MRSKHIFTLGCLFTVCLFSLCSVNAQTPIETDLQVWNDVTVNVPLDEKKKWNLSLGGVWRIGNDVRTSSDERITAVLMRRLNKTFSVGAGYVYRVSNPSFQRRLYESRYQAIGVVNVPLPGKFALSNRNILLYQSLYSRPDTSVYRTRFWLKRPIKIKKRTIEPFVAFENFWDFRADAWVRNRIQPGITTKIYKNLSGDFFYMRQNEGGKGLRRGTLNAVGSSLRVNL
jgi:hypothetical protein